MSRKDPSVGGELANAVRIMRTHQQITELHEQIKNGAEIESVLGSEKVIAAYNSVPKENLPDFLKGVPAIASEHLGSNLIFKFEEK